MTRRRALATPAAVLALPACDRRSGAPSAGERGEGEPPPAGEQRIVIAGGPLGEIVFAIGAGDRVGGADTSCTFPEAIERLPRVGYQRKLSAEGVPSLRPTLLLASHEAGLSEALAQIEGAGVRVARFGEVQTAPAAVARVRDLGAALGRAQAGGRGTGAAAMTIGILFRLLRRGGRVAGVPPPAPPSPRTARIPSHLLRTDGAPGGRAAASDRRYLLLDEPLANLDLCHQMDVLTLLRRKVREGLGVAVVLHEIGLAARACDRLLVLHGGRAVREGPPAEVLTPGLLQDVFRVRATVRHAAPEGVSIDVMWPVSTAER